MVLNGKGIVFNGNTNESYIVEYQVKEDCNSRYNFGEIEKMDVTFDEVKLSDIKEYGLKYFDGDFNIDFNNEVVYSLSDEQENTVKEFYGNMNLLNTSDIKEGEKLLKPMTFHTLNTGSDLFKELADVKLIDLKIPSNDILVLRKGNDEKYVEFGNVDIFKV